MSGTWVPFEHSSNNTRTPMNTWFNRGSISWERFADFIDEHYEHRSAQLQ